MFLNGDRGGVFQGGVLVGGRWYLRVEWGFCGDIGIGCGGVIIGCGEC